jgi:hypothetical protein
MDPREAHYFTGVGQERYYLAPAGVLRAEDMPTGWWRRDDGDGKTFWSRSTYV